MSNLDTSSEYYRKNELEPYIETAAGRRFYIDRPEFHIDEIAHALGQQCRYTGHSKRFYSVAEHSVLVSNIMRLFELGDPFEGLMHDAAEAYLSDIAAPWKALLPDYKKLEQRIELPLRQKYGLNPVMSDGCKRADWLALFVEARVLIPSQAAEWVAPPGIKEQAIHIGKTLRIECWSPYIAGAQFMHQFVQQRPEFHVV